MPKGWPDYSAVVMAPWGEAVSTAVVLGTASVAEGVAVDAGATRTLVNVSGRGRFRGLGFYFGGSAQDHTLDEIQVYIYGSLRIETSIVNLDILNGYYLGLNAAVGAVTAAPIVNPMGGLLWVERDSGGTWIRGGGYLVVDSEYSESFEVRYYNSTSESVMVNYFMLYGEYL